MDIKNLLDRDGIKLKKVSYREFAGACPWCGGRDRLRVWPDEDGGHFWCRVCGRGGDMVKYHMLTTGQHYFDACYDLGIEPRFKPRHRDGHPFKRCLPPPMAWRRNAADLVSQCHDTLLSEIGAPMRAWLSGRGINERSIELTHLGLNADDLFFDRTAWGLPTEINEDTGRPKSLWMPSGLVIPYHATGEPMRIRIRREQVIDNRYVTVSGSSKQPMRLGRLPRVVVVESDLDAILISQIAGDLVSVIALGSAALRPDAETHEFLQAAKLILLALDYDEAGAAQTAWWQRQYGAKVKRWPVPVGKDPGEAYQADVNIREWIAAGLRDQEK